MQILIVPDKFKGTLTSEQACNTIARGWLSVRPDDTVVELPMSDGGDGFGEIISRLAGGAMQSVQTVDAAHRPLQASWWWVEASRTAIVESARVIGLALLPSGKYHPFDLDTFGLGAVIKAAASRGAERCIVGVGGSATNDGGFGLARALGWQFYDTSEKPIARWTDLRNLARIDPPASGKRGAFQVTGIREFIVAVDVQNPLLGPTGSTRIYGPQKGVRVEDFPLAEACLGQLAEVMKEQLHVDAAAEPGAGAAGGLAYGLHCFAGARIEGGFSLFAQHARLLERIKDAQLVITGEGAIDVSTSMGKGVGEIARLCKESEIPCVGLAGAVTHMERSQDAFTQLHAMAPTLTSVENALAQPSYWLERLAAKVAQGMVK